MNDNRTETDDRSDTQSLDARRRRFEEDLVDAYDEELEMELDDRRFDDGDELLFSQSAARHASSISANCSACRASS